MIRELDNVVLTHDIGEHGLERGNVGVAVHCYPDETAFEVEFVTRDGHTAAVLTLTNEDIRPMDQVEQKIHILDVQMNKLDSIVTTAENDNDFDAAEERLRRWKGRTVKLISEEVGPNEGQMLEERSINVSYLGNPLATLNTEADVYRGFLQALIEELKEHPGELLSASFVTGTSISQTVLEQHVQSNVVFIVHGHDDANLLRLENLLKDRWGLESTVLKYEAGKGRTLIEKFEQEAQGAGYAIILLTPDDLIQTPDKDYTQARPNVVFELGWFYGRIGREKVCILSKRGTNIHSDLAGINRIDFNDSIEEAFLSIETELKSAGLV